MKYLAVLLAAAAYANRETTMVVIAHVLPRGPQVVVLDSWLGELRLLSARNVSPEPVSGFHVSTLVDRHREYQVVMRHARGVQEAEEEPDQARVAIHEDDPFISPIRLALGPFAPVGDRAGDQELPVRELADLGGGRIALGRPLGVANWLQFVPAPAGRLCTAPSGLLLANWPRKVANPQRDRALGDVQPGDDVVVAESL